MFVADAPLALSRKRASQGGVHPAVPGLMKRRNGGVNPALRR
jgi:hypothetical protein